MKLLLCGLIVLAALTLKPSKVMAGECGFDDCPKGFHNLFCRKFDESSKGKWVDTAQPPRITVEDWMCLVNKGGPVNVVGDLTYFFKLESHSSPGRSVTVTVKKCTVVIHDVLGSKLN